jgi:glycosyltransferase involved in cell wall biosynthesis/CBS domain-containing protein
MEQTDPDVLSLSVETNMRPGPPIVSYLNSISRVMELMAKGNVGSVVVVEGNEPVGIVTEKDILQRVLMFRKNPELTSVKDVMSKPLITIEFDRTIADALKLLQEHRIRRLIVTRKGALIGLTTERRLLEIAHGYYSMKNRGLLRRKTGAHGGKKITVAFISTYPPRECGIATFTTHLVDSMSTFCGQAVSPPVVMALNDKGSSYDYETRVKYQIDANELASYTKAAHYVNASDIDVVNIQHEYGIFGGEWGEYINGFLKRIEKPVVTTLHTLLENPAPRAREVLEGIIKETDTVIVMATAGINVLKEKYDCPPDKIRCIPHGCPNVPQLETAVIKRSFGLQDHTVLSTFGLLSSGKGVEHAIAALPQIIRKHPEVLYLIIGETHPEVRKREGEKYRQELLDKVDALGLTKNVGFVNRFLSEDELIGYLQATDVYIVPYPNREQISSGTLSYALSTGKAIVTTPFLHAEEVISSGAALRCEFRNPESLGQCVNTLLEDREIYAKFSRSAYEYSRAMIWPNVAMSYVNVFNRSLGL